MTEAKIISRISAVDTLRSLTIGTENVIHNRTIKACSVRSAVRVLRKRGYDFKVSEAGRIDDLLVIRLK